MVSGAGETPHADDQINQIGYPAGVMIVRDESCAVISQ